jgi:hypothetical protein
MKLESHKNNWYEHFLTMGENVLQTRKEPQLHESSIHDEMEDAWGHNFWSRETRTFYEVFVKGLLQNWRNILITEFYYLYGA